MKLKNYRHNRASVALVVLVLLAIMTTFVMFNAQSLYIVKRDLLLLEKQQKTHWKK